MYSKSNLPHPRGFKDVSHEPEITPCSEESPMMIAKQRLNFSFEGKIPKLDISQTKVESVNWRE